MQSDIIIGKRAVIEALRAEVPIYRVMIADNIERDSMVKDILRKASNASVEVVEVPRKKIDSMCAEDFNAHAQSASDAHIAKAKGTRQAGVAHQGVIAYAKPFQYASIAEILSKADADASQREGRALIVVCDHLTDAGNLGAVIRSAESVGASGIIIPNKRSASINYKTYKSSAGALSHIPIAQVSNIATVLEELKKSGFWVVSATEHARDLIWEGDLTGRIAFVLGNEQEGVSRLVLERSDMALKLPQTGEISSLNVAQAATACMYEWLRQNMMSEKRS